MPCASHDNMVVALDYPKLLLLNCMVLVFDHLMIFDLESVATDPDWNLISDKCTEIPEQ